MVLNITSAALGQLCHLNSGLVHPTAYLTLPLGCLTGISKLRVPIMKFLFSRLHNLSHSIVHHLLENFNSIFSVAQANLWSQPWFFLSHILCIQYINQSQCFYLQNMPIPCLPYLSYSGQSQYHLCLDQWKSLLTWLSASHLASSVYSQHNIIIP